MQLTHFTYKNAMLQKCDEYLQKRFSTDYPDQPAMDYYQDIVYKIICQRTALLDHLMYFSLTKFSSDTLYYYLLQNKNTIVLSTSISQLVICENILEKLELVYITVWLGTLPNLISLEIKNCIILNDNGDATKKERNTVRYNGFNAFKSHEWIKPHFKKLEITDVGYLFPEWDPIHNSSTSASSTPLSSAASPIKDIYLIYPRIIWNFFIFSLGDNSNSMDKLTIHETVPDHKRIIIHEYGPEMQSGKCTLSLKCKYIVNWYSQQAI
ncbi:unnamed protein product [Cunninghamella echinulata]